MDTVYIVELVIGYDFEQTYYRLRVVDSFEKAVDYISIEYPEFIQVKDNEWVSEEPITEETMRIYISEEAVF